MIIVNGLRKYFKVLRRHRGVFGSLADVFNPRYSTIRAVDGISFHIRPGELVGYLGPNGAGKSTTIKILSGLLVPSEGLVEVNHRVPWMDRKAHVANIGSVFGQRTTLWWDLPVIESLELLRHIYKIPEARFRHNLNEFRNLLDMGSFLHIPVRSLSLGQRMRADFCAALIHDPQILLLDEPTIGLDVVAKERIRQFILQINRQRGTTVLLTTHDLTDIERLCDRVMIIDQGRLLYDGNIDRLRQRFGGNRELCVDFSEKYELVDLPGTTMIENSGLRIRFQFDRDQVSASELISRLSSQYRIQDLQVREPDIEDLIRKIYEEHLLTE